MDMSEAKEAGKERLARDLKAIIDGAEELLRVTSSQAGADYQAVKRKLEQQVNVARDELDRIEHVALLKAKHAARATDAYVHDHPWQAIGAGAAIGLALGVLIGRRS